ncbi:hypothetical protein HY30_08065 [Hyphomonas chukchiensis]|jgi:hypothetical protein|uniref:Uncharacterized protein n=3 Tax=Hyphomonadaceae TaxID=69657 RepID=A0A062U9Y8_9PROT|nr:hypothetical protein [Hyphomonas sp. BRH_c22]KCZ55107.1 hypothetical protein HY30_08065 [Hyphomonas chukchiensis]KDA00726.1 hypothetical protein HOC_19126 [Hyphomonas oceanitis SCH89]|tara:strand:- start:3914 stop:4231 length:318 start_codon:yes stop_codon:yes gene_type:complete
MLKGTNMINISAKPDGRADGKYPVPCTPGMLALLGALVSFGGCTSANNILKPANAERTAIIEQACGPYPVSGLKSGESPRKIRYRICRRSTIQTIDAKPETANDS